MPELRQDIAIRRSSDLLALLSCAVMESARTVANGFNVASMAITAFLLIAVVGVRWRRGASNTRMAKEPAAIMVVALCLVVLPSVVEWASQAWFGMGQAREFHLCAWLRNLMAATLAVAPCRRQFRLVALLSLFLVVFTSSLSEDAWTWGLTATYCAAGAWWLAVYYWSGLAGRFAARTARRVPAAIQGRRWTLSLVAVVAAVAFVVAPLLAGATFFGQNATTALAGWFGTSGGTGEYDPFARAGVNDGDALVRGTEDAQSFGPVESDVFLNSDETSLYDVFNDMYGEPKRIKKIERAIALGPSFSKAKEEQKWAESKKLSREFSMLRNRPKNLGCKKMRDLDSPALLYVAGRTPLHLRVETYDTFDGRRWTYKPDPVEQQRKPPLVVQNENGKPWITTGLSAALAQPTHEELHVIKVVHLETNSIPAPLRLLKLHIDKIDRADFFAWAEGDVVRMTREKIPPTTVIRLVSQTPSVEQLQALRLPSEGGMANVDQSSSVPKHGRAADIAQLATEWAGDAERGWGRIEKVVTHLRNHCELAPDEVVPDGCDDCVAHFLLDSRRGPDYLFASASAVLLRHLGYTTRVVSGFYASPDHFDSQSRHTPIHPQDVHFWTEVELGGGVWATVEATPGYATLEPPIGLAKRCLSVVYAIGRWCWHHAIVLAACLIVMAGIVACRRRLWDAVLRCLWIVASRRSAESCIRATARLLDHRFHWAGHKRPAFATPARWFGQDVGGNALDEPTRRRLGAMLDWCFYAPPPMKQQPSEWSMQVIQETCRWAVRFWLVQRCRASSCSTQGTNNVRS